jgi:mono/diheme cytochrome c family protein
MRIPVLALLGLAAAAGPAMAAGDATDGRALALAWCTGCHVAEGGGTDVAPPLGSIANRAGRDEAYLWTWLSDPHPPMPQLSLSRQEIADLIAYLDTLRD